MCGISGIYKFNSSGTVSERELSDMRDTLIHRGPDGGANYVSSDGKVGLSQRRLAIIDLSNEAACPMTNEDRKIWITFNGEIYNFKPLREELIKKGHQMRTHGDTEVILHGYEEWGQEIVEKLNGMFAFVIWDEKKKILFAARDHMGIKPFYYAVQNGAFYFGSEIKAILAHPDFNKELEEKNISHYLTFSSLPAPFTLFKDVKKLPAAHRITLGASGELKESAYWNPVKSDNERMDEEFYVSEIRRLLKDSIKSQMVSDVPFGCFLSGGIDSSTNATLMSEALGKPVETFSVGSKEFPSYNEFQYSRQVAKTLGAKNHEILTTQDDLREFLDKFPYYADDPNGDQVCFPLYYLSQLTKRSGVTVIQIGEGSDELFAGYDTYLKAASLYQAWWTSLEKLPGFARSGAFNFSKVFSGHKFDFPREYLRRLKEHEEPFWGHAIAFSDLQKDKILTGEYKGKNHESAYPLIAGFYDEIRSIDKNADFMKQMAYLEIKHRLPELLLHRADRMTMAHSLEGRVPFLDKRLVELALQIPGNMKTNNGKTTKYILKKAVEGIIPKEIIWRKKQGFGTPMREWLRNDSSVSSMLTDIIFNSKLRKRNIFNYENIKALIGSHRHDNVEQTFRIWNLITLSLWYDYWFA